MQPSTRRGPIALGTIALATAALAAAAAPASAAGPTYFCNTAGASPAYVTLAPGGACEIGLRGGVTSVNGYVPNSTTAQGCAAPLYSDRSSAGVDCGFGTIGGSISFSGGATVYPRIKAYSGNPYNAQFRGSYYD
jgi:hypothetical protein